MGCKESKLRAVAEGNTIITPSSSRKSISRGHSNIKNNVPSLQRSRSTRASTQKQDSLKKINVGDSKARNVFKGNENSGYDKGTVNVSKVLEDEDRRLKQRNDQIAKSNEKDQIAKSNEKELIEEKNDVGVETNNEEKENEKVENVELEKENENVENVEQEKENESNVELEKENENETFLIPKVLLSSSSRNGGVGIESIITDGLSGTSVYYTPTEASGPFSNNTKSDNDEEKQESIEEIKNTDSEGAAEDDTIKNVDAIPMINVEEDEVDEKNPIETDGASPGDQEKEVAEKIRVAEAAIAALETLVKEADQTEDNDAAIQNSVEETEEIPVAEGTITDATLEKPVIEAYNSDMIRQTEAESTDATLQNPEQEADKSEDIREIEPEATDATLAYPVIESDRAEESLLKDDAEGVENGVKEIHEVADKAEEIPAKEAESIDPTDHEKQEIAANKTEDVQEKEIEVAGQFKNSVTEDEDVSIHEENPVKKSENTTKDEANTEEDTKNSSTANVHQISTEDPDNN